MDVLEIQTIIDVAEKIAISQAVFAILFILVNTLLIRLLLNQIRKYEQMIDNLKIDFNRELRWYKKAIEELIFKIDLDDDSDRRK